jgi:hypothetical protein
VNNYEICFLKHMVNTNILYKFAAITTHKSAAQNLLIKCNVLKSIYASIVREIASV